MVSHFLFVALLPLLTLPVHSESNSIRIPALMYGVHVATTVVPIMAQAAFADFSQAKVGPRTFDERAKLLSIYAPYLLIPLFTAVYMALTPHPFDAKPVAPKQKKQK